MDEELASYFLGAMRDGSAKHYDRGYEFNIWQENFEWLEKVQKIIADLFGKKPSILKDRNGFRIRFDSKKIFIWLVGAGFPKDGKHVFWNTPDLAKKNKRNFQHYVAGFFDAEGGVAKYKKFGKTYLRLDFYQSWNNKNGCPPLEDIKEFLQSIGINCGKVRSRKDNAFNKYPRYLFSISGSKSVSKFFKEIPILHPEKFCPADA